MGTHSSVCPIEEDLEFISARRRHTRFPVEPTRINGGQRSLNESRIRNDVIKKQRWEEVYLGVVFPAV